MLGLYLQYRFVSFYHCYMYTCGVLEFISVFDGSLLVILNFPCLFTLSFCCYCPSFSVFVDHFFCITSTVFLVLLTHAHSLYIKNILFIYLSLRE